MITEAVKKKVVQITGEKAHYEAFSMKGPPVGVVILSGDKTSSEQLKEQLEESYSNLSIKTFSSFMDFLLQVDPEFGSQELMAQQSDRFTQGSVTLQFNHSTDAFIKVEGEPADGPRSSSPCKPPCQKA